MGGGGVASHVFSAALNRGAQESCLVAMGIQSVLWLWIEDCNDKNSEKIKKNRGI